MTATELQSIARRLSNGSWCRYWLNLNSSRDNVMMAIQCRDAEGSPEPVRELMNLGFKEDNLASSDCFYIIKRTNQDGTPFVSQLL